MNNIETERGYEDIYSSEPYIDSEIDGKRVLLHMIYVPPSERSQGFGKSLFKSFLSELPSNIEYVRLKSGILGTGDTLPFWKALGFSSAYVCECEENSRILHLAVNGYELPQPEILLANEERHYIFD